jgi:hypothetical protein
MTSLGWPLIALGLLLGALAMLLLAGILNDRHETRVANFELRALVHPPPPRVVPRKIVAGRPPWEIPQSGRHRKPPDTWTAAVTSDGRVWRL